jgi:hypothetical protein
VGQYKAVLRPTYAVYDKSKETKMMEMNITNTVDADNCTPKPNDRTPFAASEFTGCVCRFPRNRCEPSPGMVFVECTKCGALHRIEYFHSATECYRGKGAKNVKDKNSNRR